MTYYLMHVLEDSHGNKKCVCVCWGGGGAVKFSASFLRILHRPVLFTLYFLPTFIFRLLPLPRPSHIDPFLLCCCDARSADVVFHAQYVDFPPDITRFCLPLADPSRASRVPLFHYHDTD